MPDAEYRNSRSHPVPLASGRILAPGDASPISDDAHDLALIEDGLLVPVETETDYSHLRHDQLVALADAHDLDVKGTGREGNVTNPDLIKALTAHDKKKEA